MKKIKWPVTLVTCFVVIYHFTPLLGFSDEAIMSLFIIAPFLLIWMTIKILKQGVPTDKTFDDYFYEDYAYKRNRGQINSD